MLPLETFRQELLGSISGWHFFGFADDTKYPVNSDNEDLVREYSWQALQSGIVAVGRQDIVAAIERAEERLKEYLRYAVAPHYGAEIVQAPRHIENEEMCSAAHPPWWMLVTLNEGYIQAYGTEVLTLISTPSLTYVDTDGDGINDAWSCTVTTDQTDPSNIVAYVPASDRLDADPYFATVEAHAEPIDERYKIQPIRVSFSGGTARITGRAWLNAKPILREGTTGMSPIDPTLSSNFLSTLEIYSRVTNTNERVSYIYETPSYPSLDKIEVHYLAGYPLDSNGQMSKTFQPIVARFAAAELTRPVCKSMNANQELAHWQIDQAMISVTGSYRRSSDKMIECPFGTRAGQLYAWEKIRPLKLIRGISI